MNKVAGKSVATTSEAAIRGISASAIAPKWSAEVAPTSTASPAPPDDSNSSTCNLIPRPSDRAAATMRRASFALKAPGSTNTSQNSASFRSEERRVGKECRSRWSLEHEKEKKKESEMGKRGYKQEHWSMSGIRQKSDGD